MTRRSGGRILVDALEAQGADLAFGVPGESYLEVLDALHDSIIRYVVCRMEAGAANMAEAQGKLSGRPGLCLVTRGPGATHAAVGVHSAMQASTPMLLLIGQVPQHTKGREAFQEVDYELMFAPLAKWAVEARSPGELPDLVARAYEVALGGRPGPVVIALPEDVLSGEADVPDPAYVETPARPPADADLAELRRLLAAAERPLVVVGEGGWSEEAGVDVLHFCERNRLPVLASFRCQDFVDNRSSSYAGHLTLGLDPRLAARVRDADLVIAIGGRLGEITTNGYTLIEPPRPGHTLIRVHPGEEELTQVWEPELSIEATLPETAAALAAVEPVDPSRWIAWTESARAEYLGNLEPRDLPVALDLARVAAHLREHLPLDAIVTTGAGNFSVWAHRFHEFTAFPSQLSPQSGAMGYGVPAGVAAAIMHPGRAVVAWAGDGDFLMTGQELATAVQHDARLTVLVVNNGMYGTIRMHQERRFPGRVHGTHLANPDFVALARAYGAHGELVERTDDFPAAWERAQEADGPALIELRVDPEAITPRQTITEIRGAARP